MRNEVASLRPMLVAKLKWLRKRRTSAGSLNSYTGSTLVTSIPDYGEGWVCLSDIGREMFVAQHLVRVWCGI